MKRSEILALIAKAEGDAAAKRDGFGIGELGRVPETDTTDRTMRQAQLEAVQQRIRRNRCHYCGMLANSVNFFGAPVCEECQ